jgi:hypothetical protein
MKISSPAIGILEQLKALIIQLKEAEIQLPLEVLSGASIGQHTRHILEFYICLLQQVGKQNICYDKRARNLTLEQNKNNIIENINTIITELTSLKTDKSLTVSTELCNEQHVTPSSFSREILYVIEHSVHHMAIIKIGVLMNLPHAKLNNNFGIAESTIRFNTISK